jgi:hypothetical protein
MPKVEVIENKGQREQKFKAQHSGWPGVYKFRRVYVEHEGAMYVSNVTRFRTVQFISAI